MKTLVLAVLLWSLQAAAAVEHEAEHRTEAGSKDRLVCPTSGCLSAIHDVPLTSNRSQDRELARALLPATGAGGGENSTETER